MEIIRCHEDDYEALAGIWERSVKASHDFLTEEDFREIQAALIPHYFPNVTLYAIADGGSFAGFIGFSADNIEMLFIDSGRRGRGYGSALIEFAKQRGMTRVDVNAQNLRALNFYESKGFRIIGRDERDGAGRPYPILHLSLQSVGRKGFRIVKEEGNKMQYLPLLIIGDESEAMIAQYIDQGDLYVGFNGDEPIAVCVIVVVDSDTVEVKNLAVKPGFRRQGYGRRMLRHVERLHPGRTFMLGTGETPSTLNFYISCGYSYSHRIPDFFIENYPNAIVEEGVLLCDMIYMKKET